MTPYLQSSSPGRRVWWHCLAHSSPSEVDPGSASTGEFRPAAHAKPFSAVNLAIPSIPASPRVQECVRLVPTAPFLLYEPIRPPWILILDFLVPSTVWTCFSPAWTYWGLQGWECYTSLPLRHDNIDTNQYKEGWKSLTLCMIQRKDVHKRNAVWLAACWLCKDQTWQLSKSRCLCQVTAASGCVNDGVRKNSYSTMWKCHFSGKESYHNM